MFAANSAYNFKQKIIAVPSSTSHNFFNVALLSITVSLVLLTCKTSPTETQGVNKPPETVLWVDTIGNVSTSQVTLHWWGDDPDGFVLGYLISVHGSPWIFTTSNDSTFIVSIGESSLDTADILISAVDKEGNGTWDASIFINGVNIGSEPFADTDGNGLYSAGETFVDFGLIDQTPARLSVLIKNTPPVISFDEFATVPSATLPVATFLLSVSDADGSSNVKDIFVALNDTSDTSWVPIPNVVSLLTLVADLSDTSANVVPAKLKSGITATDLNITLNNLKLNQNNILYAYCTDLTGAKSSIVRSPDTTTVWFVKKPVGRRKLLLVDDYGTANPNPDIVYQSALSQATNSTGISYGDYDVLNIYDNPINVAVAKPMLLETMKLYQFVFWYAKIANLRYAQETLPEYLQNGGKAIFTTGFENFISSSDALPLSFAPIDSLITTYKITDTTAASGYISRVYINSRVLPIDSLSVNPHPLLVYDRTAIFGTYALEPGPTDSVIYRLDLPKATNSEEKWIGNPVVGIISNNRRLVFFSAPLHFMNTIGPTDSKPRLVKLFERIFRGDFGD